jgi:hypothetical protein
MPLLGTQGLIRGRTVFVQHHPESVRGHVCRKRDNTRAALEQKKSQMEKKPTAFSAVVSPYVEAACEVIEK